MRGFAHLRKDTDLRVSLRATIKIETSGEKSLCLQDLSSLLERDSELRYPEALATTTYRA
jgi:hypothetical protein